MARGIRRGKRQKRLACLSRPWSGWGCGLVDLDNDGRLDLFVACGGLEATDVSPITCSSMWADVSQTFRATPVQTSRDAVHRGVVFADFDRDGRIDIAVSSLNQPIELWLNRSPCSIGSSYASRDVAATVRPWERKSFADASSAIRFLGDQQRRLRILQ